MVRSLPIRVSPLPGRRSRFLPRGVGGASSRRLGRCSGRGRSRGALVRQAGVVLVADGVAGGPGSRPADQLRGRLRHSAVNDGSGPDRLRRRITLHRSADGAGVPLAAAVAVLPGMPGRDRGTLATLVATAVGLRLPNPSVPAGRHLPVLRSLAADRSPPPRPRADTGSVFPQSGQRLRARSATVRRRPVGRAGATLPPRQRSSDSAIDHPGRLPQTGVPPSASTRPTRSRLLNSPPTCRAWPPGYCATPTPRISSASYLPTSCDTYRHVRCEPSGAPTARGHTRLRGRRDGRRRRRCDARHSPVPIPTPQERNCTGWFRCRGGEVWLSPHPTSGGAATSATLCTVPNYVRCHRF